MHQSLRERFVAKLQRLDQKRHEKREPAGWREGLPALAILLALAAITLGVISVLRGEVLLYAGVAATLGFGAIAFQLTFFYAIAAGLILLLYAGMEQPSGAVELAVVAVGAILVLSILAIFGMGFASALVLAGVAIAILSLDMLLGGILENWYAPLIDHFNTRYRATNPFTETGVRPAMAASRPALGIPALNKST